MLNKKSNISVLHLCTYDVKGGAAISAYRIFKAQQLSDSITPYLFVFSKSSHDHDIWHYDNNYFKKKLQFLRFALERLYFLPYEKDSSVRFRYSPAVAGIGIQSLPDFDNFDIINIHWINFGFLSLETIKHIFNSGKPIVWTFHDMWAFTGGCHYTGGCNHFKYNCGYCPLLKRPRANDLSAKILAQKKSTFPKDKLSIVTSSDWLNQQSAESSLLSCISPNTIFTPINQEIFTPQQVESGFYQQYELPENLTYLLFGAVNTQDPRKGFSFLKEAIYILYNEKLIETSNLAILTFGKQKSSELHELPIPSYGLGSIQEEDTLAKIYSLASAFILPTLEDNLPNTVIESLSCGTPVVAFNTGGIPEMVEHKKTGYIADFKKPRSLAEGISYVLKRNQHENTLGENARKSAEQKFSSYSSNSKYEVLYNSLKQ